MSIVSPLKALHDSAAGKQENQEGRSSTETESRIAKLATITSASVFVAIASLVFAVVANAQSNATVASVQDSLVTTVVAVKEIPQGSIVKEEMVETAQVPSQFVAEGALSDLGDAVGKQTTVRIDANSQIRPGELSGNEKSSSLSGKLRKGKKAVSIDVSTASDFARSLLHQGDRISLYCFQKQADGSKKKIQLAKDVAVLALDGYTSYADLVDGSNSVASYSNVTVEVDKDAAEEIRQAQDDGVTVWLVLTAASDSKN